MIHAKNTGRHNEQQRARHTDDAADPAAPILHRFRCDFGSPLLIIRYPEVKIINLPFRTVKKRPLKPSSKPKKSANFTNSGRSAGGHRATDEDVRALLETDFDPRLLLHPVRDDEDRVIDFLIAEANEAACADQRLPREELVGQRLTKLLPQVTRSELFEIYCRVLEAQEILELPEFSYQHRLYDEPRVYMIRVVPMGHELSYTWRDVTDHADATPPARPLAMERRKNRTNPDEAQMQIRELQALVQELLRSKEEQDQVISRELHDNVAQVLNAATNRITLAKDENIPAWLRQELQDLREHLEGAMSDVRTLARELRPALLDHFGFAAALKKHADDFRQRTRLTLDLHLQPETVSFFDTENLTHLFRLTQEALQNIEEHSRANRAWIRLQRDNGSIHLEIGDDGCSFTPERVTEAQAEGHLGLLGMRERAEMLGGTFQLDGEPQRGTVIRVIIPFPESGTPEQLIA